MTPKTLYNELLADYAARLPVYIAGPPGVGKSAIVKQVTKRLGIGLIDIRLAMCDPADMKMPKINCESFKWLAPEWFPTEPDSAGIIFLDELSAAPPAVQTIAYQLTYDRALGQKVLPEKWVVWGAGNTQAHRAVANRRSSALVSRFLNLTLEVSHAEWKQWALMNDIDPMVVAFVETHPDCLYNFEPATWKNEEPFSCPRSLEMLGKRLAGGKPHPEAVSGIIGPAAGMLFIKFQELFMSLPNPTAILMDPTGTPVPDDPGARVAVLQAVANLATPQNFAQALTYLGRMPKEFETVGVRDALRRTSKPDPTDPQKLLPSPLTKTKAFALWAAENSQFVFDD